MHSPRTSVPGAARGHRLFFAVAALSVNAAIFSGLVGLFDAASSMRWLSNTEANAAQMAVCAGVQGTAAHQACVAHVVASVTGQAVPGVPPVRVAAGQATVPGAVSSR